MSEWSNSPEMDAQEEAVAEEVFCAREEQDPLVPFIIITDPPDYVPDEEPAWDFPQEEPQEEYARLLEHALTALRELNSKLHDHMLALPEEGAEPALSGEKEQQFTELLILTSHIYALTKTIGVFRQHDYKPF